jgi:hypothetical protein
MQIKLKDGLLVTSLQPEMIEKEKTAWEIAMRDKHENS